MALNQQTLESELSKQEIILDKLQQKLSNGRESIPVQISENQDGDSINKGYVNVNYAHLKRNGSLLEIPAPINSLIVGNNNRITQVSYDNSGNPKIEVSGAVTYTPKDLIKLDIPVGLVINLYLDSSQQKQQLEPVSEH